MSLSNVLIGVGWLMCYPICTPVIVMCTTRGCPGNDYDTEEDEGDGAANGRKFWTLFEHVGKICHSLRN